MVIWFIKVDGNKIQHGKISVGFGYCKLFISIFQLLQRIRYRERVAPANWSEITQMGWIHQRPLSTVYFHTCLHSFASDDTTLWPVGARSRFFGWNMVCHDWMNHSIKFCSHLQRRERTADGSPRLEILEMLQSSTLFFLFYKQLDSGRALKVTWISFCSPLLKIAMVDCILLLFLIIWARVAYKPVKYIK